MLSTQLAVSAHPFSFTATNCSHIYSKYTQLDTSTPFTVYQGNKQLKVNVGCAAAVITDTEYLKKIGYSSRPEGLETTITTQVFLAGAPYSYGSSIDVPVIVSGKQVRGLSPFVTATVTCRQIQSYNQ